MRIAILIIACCIFATCNKNLKKIDIIIEPGKKIGQVQGPKTGVKFPVKSKPVETAIETITVYFDFDSYKIKPSEEVGLLEAAIAVGSKSVTIKGYACPIGTDIYNLDLSRRRAVEVATFFENHSARGYGETDLVSYDFKTYYKNRRVIVEVE